MKIYSITNNPFLNYERKSTENNRKINKYSEFDAFVKRSNVSFGSNEISVDNGLLAEFNSKYKKVYGNCPVETVISENIENLPLLNLGKDKKVYRFPKLEEYIIAYWYNLQDDKKNLPMV